MSLPSLARPYSTPIPKSQSKRKQPYHAGPFCAFVLGGACFFFNGVLAALEPLVPGQCGALTGGISPKDGGIAGRTIASKEDAEAWFGLV